MRHLWRSIYRRLLWPRRCEDCGRRLYDTAEDERECVYCNVIYPDYTSPFYREVVRRVRQRT